MIRRWLGGSALVIAFALTTPARASVHVAPAGDDDAAGTLERPVRSMQQAVRLAGAAGDDRVELAAGEYPVQVVQSQHPAVPVVITGPGAVLAGVRFADASGLTLRGVTVTGRVKVDSITGLRGPSSDITVERNRFEDGQVTVQNAANRVTIRENVFTGGNQAIGGPGRVSHDYASRGIVIEHNVIDGPADGIQLGDWDDVTVRGNVIRDLHDARSRTIPPGCHPAGQLDPSTPECVHDDGVQFTGRVTGAVIDGNVIDGSASQGMLIQSAIGPISNVTIRGNTVTDISNQAIDFEGVTAGTVTGNVAVTRHPDRFPGIWLRGYHGLLPQDYVATGNTGCHVRLDPGVGGTISGNAASC